MICNKCGKEITDDSKFCEYCGNSISDVEHITTPTKSKKPIIIITIICVIICVVIFGAWSLIQKDNKTNNNSQSKAQNYNNSSTSNSVKTQTTSEQETKSECISLFDLQTVTYKNFSLDSIGGYNSFDSLIVLKVYQIKAEQYNDLLYTYTITTNIRR